MRLIVMLLLLPGLALAEGLVAHSPTENATIESGGQQFTFTATQNERLTYIDACDVLINGSKYKTVVINGALQGQTRSIAQRLEPGTYRWVVECQSEKGSLSTQSRTVHVVQAAQSEVVVEASGAFRGSFVHMLTMENSPSQNPIFVPKVAPGDFVEISTTVIPSTYEREFYIKNRFSQDGNNYIRMTSGSATFEVFEGENVTLPVGNANVIMEFTEMDGTRMNLMIYPVVPDSQEPEIEPEEPTPEPEEPEVEPEIEPEEPAPEPEPPTTERQGFFSWVMSLMARLFGA